MAIDNIRSFSGASIYGLDNFCCGKKSFGSIFAKGMYTEGAEIVDVAMEKLRSLLERCDCP
jgi:tubulin beta